MRLQELLTELIRVVAGRRKRSPWHEGEAERQMAETKEPDDYGSCGAFSPNEASVVLERLKEAGLRFRIDCDTSAGHAGINGAFRERRTIKVFVHPEDAGRASEVVSDWRREVGRIAPKNA